MQVLSIIAAGRARMSEEERAVYELQAYHFDAVNFYWLEIRNFAPSEPKWVSASQLERQNASSSH